MAKHYNYFRDYDPSIGRYLQSDPLGIRVGRNTFGYVTNRPLSKIDPAGLFTLDPSCKDCKYSNDIERDGNAWCDTAQHIVTNPTLASCIKSKCPKATISCADPSGDCGKNSNTLGYAWNGETAIYLCTRNWSTGYGAGAIIVHEFAHTCGWGHGNGFNVPGGDGSLNPYSYGHGLF